uniref:Secreted protein n=1 Tax=Trichogramma kaykai TaxID=54128 RepID=A0ABD2WV47_9HYME
MIDWLGGTKAAAAASTGAKAPSTSICLMWKLPTVCRLPSQRWALFAIAAAAAAVEVPILTVESRADDNQ